MLLDSAGGWFEERNFEDVRWAGMKMLLKSSKIFGSQPFWIASIKFLEIDLEIIGPRLKWKWLSKFATLLDTFYFCKASTRQNAHGRNSPLFSLFSNIKNTRDDRKALHENVYRYLCVCVFACDQHNIVDINSSSFYSHLRLILFRYQCSNVPFNIHPSSFLMVLFFHHHFLNLCVRRAATAANIGKIVKKRNIFFNLNFID